MQLPIFSLQPKENEQSANEQSGKHGNNVCIQADFKNPIKNRFFIGKIASGKIWIVVFQRLMENEDSDKGNHSY